MDNAPERKHVWANRASGNYNWANLNETQWQYFFHNVPDGLQKSFVVKEELDTEDVLWLAEEIRGLIHAHLYHGDVPKIDALVVWLREEDDNQYRLILEYEIELQEWKIKQAVEKLKTAQLELRALKTKSDALSVGTS